MSSKTNNRNRANSPALSTSASQSPYNFRRNRLEPGAVAKRKNTKKSKKNISISISQPPDLHASSSTSQNTLNSPELASNDDTNTMGHSDDDEEQSEGNDDTNTMQHSDDDEEELEENISADETERSDDQQQVEGSSDTGSMERSACEEEGLAYIRHSEREKKKLPSVWSHFDLLCDNIYICQYCSKSIKTYNDNDTNLRSHLGRAHQMLEVMYKSQRQQRASKLNAIKPERKRQLDDAAVDCIITDGRPFGDFRRLGMSKFLKVVSPGYSGPSRKTVRRQPGYSYHAYRAELRATLASINSIAITVDVWTKHQTSFICLTGHVFNKAYSTLEKLILN